ncbi:metalloregulator ArsR/SmtB family transcription factor [Pseudomonas sp. F1_0610]|uniref:metalloregulator ArsR/SmtB family transcription factor n=1 Tax=Pseudomonas sp. F1_0610 TaxID=3114284 RepID=UPI0039C1962A
MNAQVEIPSANLEQLKSKAESAGNLLKALGNPDRLLLLCQLVDGEMNVRTLEDRLGIMQPTLSQQLGVLRRENLVNTRRDGRQIFYSIKCHKALAITELLQALYSQKSVA